MEYRILGPLEIRANGRAIPLAGAKQRALLIILLLHPNEVVPTDRLIDELWGNEPPETAHAALQVHVSQLRKALGADAIATRRPGYVLNLEPGQLDLDRFNRLRAEGREALARGDSDVAAEKLADALALWRGPPLADFVYEDFAQAEIARLEDLRLSALEDRIEADLSRGRHADLVPELERLVAQHPLRERLRGQLMLALYRSGRQADALVEYQKARRMLVEQVGIEPGPALQQLEKAILIQDPTIDAAPRGARPRAPVAAVRSLGWPALIACAGAVIIAAAVAAVVVTRGGSSGPSAAVAPNSVVVIDAHTNKLVTAIPVGDGPADVEVAEDIVYVLNRNSRTVSAIDPQAGKVVDTFGVGERGHAMELNAAGLWVADAQTRVLARFRGAVSRIALDEAGDLASRIALDEAGELAGAGVALAAEGDAVWALAWLPPTVLRVEASDVAATVTRRFALDRRPAAGPALVDGALALGGGFLWVANVDGTVSRVDPESGAARALEVGQSANAVAFGDGSAWVALIHDDAVARVDPQPLGVSARIRVGDEPVAIAIGEGAVWVANRRDRTVSRIDPDTNRVVATIAVARRPEAIGIGAGHIWVTVRR